MVLFHRSGSQSQRAHQPSRNSPPYDASTDEPTVPFSPDASLSRPRANSEVPKRLSVFGGRSRSNTATSSSPPHRSPTSSMTSVEQSSRRSSQDGRSMSSLGIDRPESAAKSLFTRGSRILRRQNSKFSISSSLTLDEEEDGARSKFDVSELWERGSKARSRSNSITTGKLLQTPFSFNGVSANSTKGYGLKHSISEPFNFHHVTHTNQRQLPSLHRVSDNELVTEFSVIRASQKPKPELKGIRADDIHFRNFSSEDLNEQVSPETVDSKPSPSSTPPHSRESSRQFVTPPAIRNSRSIENFSRPAPRSPKSPTSPIAPPPRTSSRAACTPSAYDSTRAGINDIISPISNVNVFNVTDPSTPKNQSSLLLPITISSGVDAGDEAQITHAVTTADDTARQLRPLTHAIFPPELADVPEEDETTFWQGSPARPSTGHSSLRHVQSFPSARVSFDRRTGSRQSSQALGQSPLESPAIQSPRSLGAPFEPEQSPSAPRGQSSVKRFSIGLKAIDGCWEDVVDYSYDHAAESSCNFDWDRRSVEDDEDVEIFLTPNEFPTSVPVQQESRFFPGSFKPPKLDTSQESQLAVPDLEPTSAQSKSTTQEAVTPLSHQYGPRGFAAGRSSRDSDYFKTKPLHISSTFEEAMYQHVMYEELISGTEQNDSRFPFYSHPDEVAQSQPVSERSSGSPISNCNSQESIILSGAASVVRKHRSSNSATSLPELVHSIHESKSHEEVDDAAPIAHKRSISLVKDTAHHPLLKIDDEEKTSIAAGLSRDRSKIVSELPIKHSPASNTTGSAVQRKNSGPKSGPRVGSRTSSRSNYSLFPSAMPPSPSKEEAI